MKSKLNLNQAQVWICLCSQSCNNADDDWNCDGIYLPTGTKVAGLLTDPLTEPLALKVTSGAQFVAKANPTGDLEFNLNPAKLFKAGEGNLPILDLAQTAIESTKPNAPIEG